MTHPIEHWYQITFDHKTIYLSIHPSEQKAQKIGVEWATIERVCFKPGDYIESDEIYIFTTQREESYLIPVEAAGGQALWMEIIRRGLFDAQLAIDVAAKSGGVFCWPEG